MKIIVSKLPKYADDCIFCENRYYDVCSINGCQCELTKRNDCPYLITINEYLASIFHSTERKNEYNK